MKPLNTQDAPRAIGPYSQGVCAGNLVFLAGQIPLNARDGSIPESVADQTRQCLSNAAAVLKEAGCTLADAVDVTVFLTDMNNFAAMNQVYAEFFTQPYPARAAVEVSALPKGVSVEIKITAMPAD